MSSPSKPRPADPDVGNIVSDDNEDIGDDELLFNKLSKIAVDKPHPLNNEFLYFSATLKEIAPSLSSEIDRQKVIPWLRKLLRPEYHSSMFREKRNRYLMCLTITLMNDEVYSPFTHPPPLEALPELHKLPAPVLPPAEWEQDDTWHELLDEMPDGSDIMACSLHSQPENCETDHEYDKILDDEFTYMLYLAKPYSVMMTNSGHRSLVKNWLQVLCSIRSEVCSSMKALRNDYIMALLGYIQDLRVEGPFLTVPVSPLRPLVEAAELCASNTVPLDPGGREICEFLEQQPLPEEGAFCYVALTGDLVASNFDEID